MRSIRWNKICGVADATGSDRASRVDLRWHDEIVGTLLPECLVQNAAGQCVIEAEVVLDMVGKLARLWLLAEIPMVV